MRVGLPASLPKESGHTLNLAARVTLLLKLHYCKIQFRVEKSPSGLVKVALAGSTTSVSAVVFTLPDITATGKATMNTAEQITVATKQPGRTTAMSHTIAPGSVSDA
jgi:hypothetical protein